MWKCYIYATIVIFYSPLSEKKVKAVTEAVGLPFQKIHLVLVHELGHIKCKY